MRFAAQGAAALPECTRSRLPAVGVGRNGSLCRTAEAPKGRPEGQGSAGTHAFTARRPAGGLCYTGEHENNTSCFGSFRSDAGDRMRESEHRGEAVGYSVESADALGGDAGTAELGTRSV